MYSEWTSDPTITSACIAAHLQKAMSKYGELWDDSALVKALDDAISKYKIMHGKGGDNGSLNEEKITKDTKETAPNFFNESYEAKSTCMETDNNVTDVPKNTTHTIEAADSSVAEKCTSETVEQNVSGNEVQDTHGTYVNAESADHYNLLLNQYNAVEEQRQKLLQQLYQYGNWDSQGYGNGYGYGYGTDYGYNSQNHTEQTSGPPICCCRPYVCSSSTAPCTSIPHNVTSVSVEEDDRFIKAAMGAVDKAIHSFNKEISGISDEEGNKGQEIETGSREVAKETSQTDLSIVLNAWFSAGFYTGKYLSEQASAKK